MSESLRDELHAAARVPLPTSTVDVDEALDRGIRRHNRKVSALAAGGAVAVAAAILAGSSIGKAAGLPRASDGSTPNSVFSPPRAACQDFDSDLAMFARSVMPDSAGWSAPQPLLRLVSCDRDRGDSRSFVVNVWKSERAGSLTVSVENRSGVKCFVHPGSSANCREIPEGNLSLMGVDQPAGRSWVSLVTKHGSHTIVASTDRCPVISTVPCRTTPPYTVDQLGELAAAIARTL